MPLLPTPSRNRILHDSSKSLYFFFEQKKLLYLGSSLVSPTMTPSLMDQMSVRPCQLSGLRKSAVSSARAERAGNARIAAANSRRERRMVRLHGKTASRLRQQPEVVPRQ